MKSKLYLRHFSVITLLLPLLALVATEEGVTPVHRRLRIDLGLQGPINKKRILERSQVIF